MLGITHEKSVIINQTNNSEVVITGTNFRIQPRDKKVKCLKFQITLI